MGRYPLRTIIDRYVEANRAYLAKETVAEKHRKLMAFALRYEEMCKKNPHLKKSPDKWREKEIMAIVADIKARGWSLETQAKELSNIQGILSYVGNGILDKVRATQPHFFPKRSRMRGPSLSEGQLWQLLSSVSRMTGWTGEVACFTVHMLAHTGLRPGELRKASIDDLDLASWTIKVGHPKGEGSYGEHRLVPILPPARQAVIRYLKARDEKLACREMRDAKPLLCSARQPSKHISSKRMRHIKHRVEVQSGVKFELRTLRRTYGQVLLNRNVTIDSVSIALGHSSTRTTEKYYCRKDADSARAEILNAFGESAACPSAKPPLIETRYAITGYG